MARTRASRRVRGLSTVSLLIVVTGLLAIGQAPAAQATKPVRPRPDLQVEVGAPRNILPVDGWSRVSTTVRNLGTAPASKVQLTIALPSQLHDFGMSTTDEWDCTTEPQWPRTWVCDHVGDLAAGVAATPVDLSVQPFEATVGQTVEARAEVTTSSRDRDLSNNSTTGAIAFVGTGLINGRMWNDLNANGVREAGEPNASVQISFWSVDDEDQYGVANPYNGMFDFYVPAKRYYGEIRVRKSQWSFTTPDVGDDTTDSDFTQITEDSFYRTARSDEFVVAADGNGHGRRRARRCSTLLVR